MPTTNAVAVMVFVCLVFFGIVYAARRTGPSKASVYALSIATILGMTIGFYTTALGVVLLLQGSLIDFMSLLGGTSGSPVISRVYYVLSISWEELTKAAVLIIFLRSMTPPLRSVGTYLLPGYMFGMIEGIMTLSLVIPDLHFELGIQNFFLSLADIFFAISCTILGHALVMVVYRIFHQRCADHGWKLLLPLAGAIILHLSYNEFIAPYLSGFSVYYGASSFSVYLTASAIALVTAASIVRSNNPTTARRPANGFRRRKPAGKVGEGLFENPPPH